MPSTYSNLLFHVVFSTKERRKLLSQNITQELYPYFSGIASKNNFKIRCINGTNDHVHLLLSLTPEISLSKAMQLIKGNSSKWIHEHFNPDDMSGHVDLKIFAWQEGYGAFTVSNSQVDTVKNYIQNQIEHHKKMTFKEELVTLLNKNNIEFNPKYLF